MSVPTQKTVNFSAIPSGVMLLQPKLQGSRLIRFGEHVALEANLKIKGFSGARILFAGHPNPRSFRSWKPLYWQPRTWQYESVAIDPDGASHTVQYSPIMPCPGLVLVVDFLSGKYRRTHAAPVLRGDEIIFPECNIE